MQRCRRSADSLRELDEPASADRGTDTYAAAAGSHDDLVLALSLALWTAEHRTAVYPGGRTTSVPRGRIPGVRPEDPFLRRRF